MPTAIITGITGQDGSYLAQSLLGQGTSVVGVVRNREHAMATIFPNLLKDIAIEEWDWQCSNDVREVFARHRPDEIYNLAAYAQGSAMFDNPAALADVNGVAVVKLLEAMREEAPQARFCQASSSEMYGAPFETPQSEATPLRPISPYGAAKQYAHSMVGIYRRRHGLFACSAILFNHESPRRGHAYVTRKISHAAAGISLGLASELKLGNLEARRDWGFAPDYVDAMQLMLKTDKPDDFVIATGVTHSIRDFCECAFDLLGLDYRDHVVHDESLTRTGEATQLVGDASKAAAVLGWKPTVAFRDMVGLMVEHDLAALRTTPVPRTQTHV